MRDAREFGNRETLSSKLESGTMSDARRRIVARIREQQGKPAERDPSETALVRAYIDARSRSPAPHDSWDAITRFRERALSLASTLAEVPSLSRVPASVATYLQERGLPCETVCWPDLATLDWATCGIAVDVRSAVGDDLVGITGCYCAIAETGSLMLLSGADVPPSVSLLPETHIAVVRRSRIVSNMEDAWELARAEHRELPRAVNFISGPSRTADIEQTVTLGAHGPYRVHIVLVDV
jgi:L-lactate dehydrogenase complex protein LldG